MNSREQLDLKPKKKYSHHFHFDTLTTLRLRNWIIPHDPKIDCTFLIKDNVVNTFRKIWSRGDNVSIITAGTHEEIVYLLSSKGLTSDELNKIYKYDSSSLSYIKENLPLNAIQFFLQIMPDVQCHIYYDYSKTNCNEVRQLKQEFAKANKTLSIRCVRSDLNNQDYLISDNPFEKLISIENQFKDLINCNHKKTSTNFCSLFKNHPELSNQELNQIKQFKIDYLTELKKLKKKYPHKNNELLNHMNNSKLVGFNSERYKIFKDDSVFEQAVSILISDSDNEGIYSSWGTRAMSRR